MKYPANTPRPNPGVSEGAKNSSHSSILSAKISLAKETHQRNIDKTRLLEFNISISGQQLFFYEIYYDF
jgi:hypothetical protein